MEHRPQIVLAVTAMMGDVFGMFFQLTALMFACFEGVRRPAVIVTVTVNMDMLHAHIIERGTDPLYHYVCVRTCVLTQAILSVYQLDARGQIQLRFRPGPSLTPQPLQSWPWLILLSFTFLSEIYYLLPWLVFYGLMTSNRSHHQGQSQLHPLCFCSSKCNLVCCLWDPFWFRIPDLTKCAMTID